MGIKELLESLEERRLDFSIASVFFGFHVIVNHLFSYPEVRPDATLVFLQPIRFLFEHGNLVWSTSSNFYTGNPFFVIPVFEMIGYTPLNLKIFMSVMMALSTVGFYFFYKKIFNRRTAVSLVLILFTFNNWLVYRYMDWTYILFLEAVILYLYASWIERGGGETYLLPLVSGLAFYFKTIVLYLLAGLFVTTLVNEGKEFFLDMEPREIAVSGLMLLIGLSPFILYSFNVGFEYLEAAGFTSPVTTVIAERAANLAMISWPGIINYSIDSGILPLYHVYIPLLITGFLLSLKKGESRRYAIVFSVVLLLSLKVVHRVSFRQVIILLPFLPIFIHANLDVLSLDEKQKSYLVSTLAIAVIVLSFFTVDYSLYGNQSEWDIDPHNYTLKHEELSGPLAVNYYEAYLRASYDMEIFPLYFLSADNNTHENLNPILQKRDISLDRLDQDTSLLLIEGGVCKVNVSCREEGSDLKTCRKNGCGYPTDTIKDNLSLGQPDRQFELDNRTYSYYK